MQSNTESIVIGTVSMHNLVAYPPFLFVLEISCGKQINFVGLYIVKTSFPCGLGNRGKYESV